MTHNKLAAHHLWIFAILTLLVLFAVAQFSESRHVAEQKERIEALNRQFTRLNDEYVSLQRTLDFSKTDDYIARIARTKFGLLKPGEVRFVSDDSVRMLP